MSFKHCSRLKELASLYLVFNFARGMGLSQSAIHGLVLLERTSVGISLCDAWLR